MYSVPQRLSALFALSVSLGLTLVLFITVSTWFMNSTPGPIQVEFYQLGMNKANDGYNRKFQRVTDAATLKLNIQADFKPLFHWNVKEIFAYLVLEYESSEYGRNEVVIWDRIITQQDPYLINVDNAGNKYPIVDIGDNLGGTKATLKLKWNTVPWTGFLFDTVQTGEKQIQFPKIVTNPVGSSK
jgi:signal peptidase complex subunit 3